ncbi:hypothetical protein [Planctomicrobium sp. SH527]|uniref:hypothetical protein n=1 Tax=Planctomicrobium sp. SH527 TaxID=3448123 RepID=UPI003F5B3DE8
MKTPFLILSCTIASIAIALNLLELWKISIIQDQIRTQISNSQSTQIHLGTLPDTRFTTLHDVKALRKLSQAICITSAKALPEHWAIANRTSQTVIIETQGPNPATIELMDDGLVVIASPFGIQRRYVCSTCNPNAYNLVVEMAGLEHGDHTDTVDHH